MLLDKHTNVLTNNEWCNVILHVLYPILKDVLMDIVGVKEYVCPSSVHSHSNSNAVLRNRVNRMAENSVISLLLVVMVNVFTYRMESIVTNEEFGRIWVQVFLLFSTMDMVDTADLPICGKHQHQEQFSHEREREAPLPSSDPNGRPRSLPCIFFFVDSHCLVGRPEICF